MAYTEPPDQATDHVVLAIEWNAWVAANIRYLKAAVDALDPSAAWPIGSIHTSIVATNPATTLGFGTWTAFGAGRVLVGLNAADADFDTVEETGGAKTHTHTGPSHTHTGPSHTHAAGTLAGPSHTHTGPLHTHTAALDTGEASSVTTSGPNAYNVSASGAGVNSGTIDHTHTLSHHHSFSGNTGADGTGATGASGTGAVTGATGAEGTGATGASGTAATGAGSGVQPYIVVHLWKRTA